MIGTYIAAAFWFVGLPALLRWGWRQEKQEKGGA